MTTTFSPNKVGVMLGRAARVGNSRGRLCWELGLQSRRRWEWVGERSLGVAVDIAGISHKDKRNGDDEQGEQVHQRTHPPR